MFSFSDGRILLLNEENSLFFFVLLKKEVKLLAAKLKLKDLFPSLLVDSGAVFKIVVVASGFWFSVLNRSCRFLDGSLGSLFWHIFVWRIFLETDRLEEFVL